MRLTVGALVVLLLALGLGSGLSWVSVRENQGFGALTIGPWTAWPKAGSAGADPYTKARVAVDGEVPLGAAEGIVFTARADDAGVPLRSACSYEITGLLPQARFWSLTAVDLEGRPLRSLLDAPAELLSTDVMWTSDQGISATVSATAMPGNWLPLTANTPFSLVLTLYDSQITSGSSVVSPVLPSITRRTCSA
ncbi:MAG: DUF1214 domain-containing protein [Pseudomonadota bacterium]